MGSRWDDEDELDRGRHSRGVERDPPSEQTVGDVIDAAVRKIVTAIVIAGGLIGLAIWSRGGGGSSAPDYQITAADGRMYRLETGRGRVIACQIQGGHCWIVLRRGQDLDDEAPKQDAVPAPAQPQAVPAQPAPAQLPAPQNAAAPVPAAR